MRKNCFALAPLAVLLLALPAAALTFTGNPQTDGWRLLGNSLTGEAGSGDSVFAGGVPTFSMDVYSTFFTVPGSVTVTAAQGNTPLANPLFDDAFASGTYQAGDRVLGIGGVIVSGAPTEFAFLSLDFDNNNGVVPATSPGAMDAVIETPGGDSLLTEGDLVFQVGGVEQLPFTWFPNFAVLAEVDNPSSTNPSLAAPGEVSTPFVPTNAIANRGLDSPFRSLANRVTPGPSGAVAPATTFELFYNVDAAARSGLNIGELQDTVSFQFSTFGSYPGAQGAGVAFNDIPVNPAVSAPIPEPVTPVLAGLGVLALVYRVTRRRAA